MIRICTLFILFLLHLANLSLADSYFIQLKGVPKYEGKHAWKNQVKLFLNPDQNSSYAQPFDYYEIILSFQKLKINKDSLMGTIGFSLPMQKGNYQFSFKAVISDTLFYGSYEGVKDQSEYYQGQISGYVSNQTFSPPTLKIPTVKLPALPNPEFNRVFTKNQLWQKKKIYQLTDFGSISSGQNITSQLQQAIDACAAGNGGIINIPAGKYICGSIELRSHVMLYLSDNTVLQASIDSTDYKIPYLIFADGIKDAGIAGLGKIDAQGFHWLDTNRMEYPHRMDAQRLFYAKKDLLFWPTILFKESQDLIFTGFEIKDSPSWHLTLLSCKNVVVDDIKLNTPINVVRTDGIDLIGCQNIKVRNCRISCGDDAIVIKGHNQWQHYNVTTSTDSILIENCAVTTSCNGLKTGTETNLDIQNIYFNNCLVYNNPEDDLRAASAISITSVDGSQVESIKCENIRIENVHTPVFLRLGRRNKHNTGANSTMKNIYFNTIKIFGSDQPTAIHGLPEQTIQNVVMENIEQQMNLIPMMSITEEVPLKPEVYPNADRFGDLPAWGIYARFVDGLVIRKYRLDANQVDQRRPVLLINCNIEEENWRLDNIKKQP